MLLTLDIRNSGIAAGIFRQEDLIYTCRISAKHSRTADQYALLLKEIFALEGIEARDIRGAIVASVVPQLTHVLKKAVEMMSGCPVILVDTALKEKLDLFDGDPAEIAADAVCAAYYTIRHYSLPAIIVDNGTAIKFVGIDRKGRIAGCAFCPGIELSLAALTRSTAQLPGIAFHSAARAIGKTTEEALNSGLILGAVSMIDGMLDRFAQELGGCQSVILTGMHTQRLAPLCKRPMIVNNHLALEGMQAIFQKL